MLQASLSEGKDGAVGIILQEYSVHKDQDRLMGDL